MGPRRWGRLSQRNPYRELIAKGAVPQCAAVHKLHRLQVESWCGSFAARRGRMYIASTQLWRWSAKLFPC
jgi:hypothetical protein